MLGIQDLFKTFLTPRGAVKAVQGVDLEVKEGEVFTLLGPSGCGKTTILRCIAGLETPDRGHITIGNQIVFSCLEHRTHSIPSYLRPIGMVFQSYAVWPHMTVWQNVAYLLKYGVGPKVSKSELNKRVEKVLALVRLSGLEDRPTPLLSGGQQQRVALARALVREPDLLLLDEPLSNLDAKLRTEMRLELRDLFKELGITAFYVTHDQVEALVMSDRLAITLEGRIIQEGKPQEVYRYPKDAFVVGFLGNVNLIKAKVKQEAGDGGFGLVETKIGSVYCPLSNEQRLRTDVLLTIRPEYIIITHDAKGHTSNVFPAKIRRLSFVGDALESHVDVGGELLQVKVDALSKLQSNEDVFIVLPPELCFVLNA